MTSSNLVDCTTGIRRSGHAPDRVKGQLEPPAAQFGHRDPAKWEPWGVSCLSFPHPVTQPRPAQIGGAFSFVPAASSRRMPPSQRFSWQTRIQLRNGVEAARRDVVG
jgi:hypothetical protein